MLDAHPRRQSTTTEHVAAFLVFAVVAAVTPGPSNLMLTAAGAHAGVLRGLPCLFGVTTGMGLMMVLVPYGLGRVVRDQPAVLAALHWGGAAVLLWLAWKIATSASDIASTPDRDPIGFVGAAVFQWVNPKSWLVAGSAAATFLGTDAERHLLESAALGGLFFVAAAPSGFVWLAFGATLQRLLRDRRRRRLFNVAMGAALALSIALIAR